MDYLQVVTGAGAVVSLVELLLRDDDTSGSEGQLPFRYTLFVAASEQKAIRDLQDAYNNVLNGEYRLLNFDNDGFLVYKGIERDPHKFDRPREHKNTNDTIFVKRYKREILVGIEILDSDGEPVFDNLMLTRYLMQKGVQH